jgi:large subunit ribosomal protein L13
MPRLGAGTFSRPDFDLTGPGLCLVSLHLPTMSTTHIHNGSAPERWLVYDATDRVLGRMASDIAMKLMSKDQPIYTPNVKTGAFVVVVNAEKVKITGKKSEQKTYAHYTGYPSGRKEVDYTDLQDRRPEEIIRLAVRRMLPKTILGRQMYTRLKVYSGPNHPHAAQQPVNA